MPTGLHGKTMDDCSMEHMGMDHHMPDMEVPCDEGLSCMCSIGEAPVKTEIPVANVQPTIELTAVVEYIPTTEVHTSIVQTEYTKPIYIQDYGPPLFILNQTFLN